MSCERKLNWYYGRIIEAELWSQGIHPKKIERLKAKARVREKALQRILRERSWETIDPTLRISTTLTPEKIRRSLDKDATPPSLYRKGSHMIGSIPTRLG